MMVNHKPYTEWIQLALDGDLQAEQRVQLDAHLAECQSCAATWEALTRLERLFTQAPLAAPRPGFTNRFSARLKQQRSQPKALWGALALGLGAVGSAALVLPLGLSALWSLVQLIGQPAASAALFNSASTTTQVALALANALFITGRGLGEWALNTPMVWVAVLGAMAATIAWVYYVRRLSLQGLGL